MLGYLLILGIDETLKAKVRIAMPGSSSRAEIFLEKTTRSAFSCCYTRMPDAILIEWRTFPAEEITTFLQKIRKHADGRTVPIAFLAQKLAPAILSVAAEYDIFQVVTNLGVPNALKKLIQSLDSDARLPEGMSELLDRLRQAQSAGEESEFSRIAEAMFKAHPENPIARFEWANLCLRQGKTTEAKELARRSLAHNPHNLRASNILARAHMMSGEHQKAVEVLQAAEALSPRNLERLVLLGDAFATTRRPPDARKSYQTALKVDPASTEAASGLVALELGDADINEALAVLRSARTPLEQASLFNTAGIAAARLQDLEHATSLYETALAFLDRADLRARVQFNVGLAFERAGRLTEAVIALRRASEMDPSFTKSRARLAALAGDHLPPPAPIAEEADLTLDPPSDDAGMMRPPSLIEMVSQGKVLKPFPVQVLKPPAKSKT